MPLMIYMFLFVIKAVAVFALLLSPFVALILGSIFGFRNYRRNGRTMAVALAVSAALYVISHPLRIVPEVVGNWLSPVGFDVGLFALAWLLVRWMRRHAVVVTPPRSQ